MTAGRATVSAVAAVLAAALLVVVLVTWAASIGPGGVLEGPGIEAQRSSPSPTESTPDAASGTPRTDRQRLADERRRDRPNPWLRTIAFVVELATLCLVLFLLFRFARWLREAYDARRRRDERPEEVAFDVIEAPGLVAREILHDAEAQRRVLARGRPGQRDRRVLAPVRDPGRGGRALPAGRGRPRRSSRCASSTSPRPTTGPSPGWPACTARRGSPSTR